MIFQRLAATVIAAENTVHSGNQFSRPEGLGNIIIGTKVKPGNHTIFIIRCRQKNDRNIRVCLDGTAQRKAASIDGSGFSLCCAIKANSDIPVIFLTASDDEYSVVAGLDLGADDYIPKPFRPRELISRMNSVLRRYHRGSQPLEYHELKADTVRGLVYKNNVELTLSALEYRLLLLFLSNQGIVLTRSRLLDELWDMAGEFVNDNTLTVYIKRLREKIEADPAHPEYIKTIRGLGYKLGD